VRTRTLAALLLALVGVIAFAPVASAQETPTEAEIIHEAEQVAEENGATKFDAECIKILVEGGKVDRCQESPSPILPAANELLYGSLSFVILLLLIGKFAYPAIKQGMETRTERIRSDLDAAETTKTEAETVLAEYKAQLAESKSEAGRIIEEARQAADALKRDQEARVQTEIAEMRARAAADLESAKQQAIADASHEIAALAIGAAEVVIKRNLDPATQSQLVEEYIAALSGS
jgi:F-type H+-transporting ATPase subunit b